jgi:two-component system, NarL family, response regulator DevR
MSHVESGRIERSPARFRLLLVDDHEVIRRGLRESLETDFQVVGEAATVEGALRSIETLSPDVVVLDVRLPDGNGIELCREIRSRGLDVRILMLSSFMGDTYLEAVIAGADGYLLKQAPVEEIVMTISRLAHGESLIDDATRASVSRRLADHARNDPLKRLTPQEARVLALVAEGLTKREIAGRAGLSERTVKNYVSIILTKLGMRHRTQAAVYVRRRAAGES